MCVRYDAPYRTVFVLFDLATTRSHNIIIVFTLTVKIKLLFYFGTVVYISSCIFFAPRYVFAPIFWSLRCHLALNILGMIYCEKKNDANDMYSAEETAINMHMYVSIAPACAVELSIPQPYLVNPKND